MDNTTNETLLSLQQQITTPAADDPDFVQNFRSLASTVFFLEDCLMEETEE